MLVTRIFTFPLVFSKDLYCRHVKPDLVWERVNPLPHYKIQNFNISKLRAPENNTSNAMQNIKNIKLVFHRIENIVGKGENAGYHHFLLYPQCFQKARFSGMSKASIMW